MVGVAQLVERWLVVPDVAGSSPVVHPNSSPVVGCLAPAVRFYAEAVPRPSRSTPAELSPEPWPAHPSPDPSAEVARRLVRNLEREIAGRSIRSVAEAAQVDHSTLLGLLRGRSWPDLVTIARLERGLGADLWPGRLERG